MTIQNGALSDGSAVSDAGNDEGAPCLTVHMGSDGGFVAYYCPSGMNPAMAVKTKTDAGTNFDNTSYDRLFSTQAPPYVQTWYRQADLDAATRG